MQITGESRDEKVQLCLDQKRYQGLRPIIESIVEGVEEGKPIVEMAKIIQSDYSTLYKFLVDSGLHNDWEVAIKQRNGTGRVWKRRVNYSKVEELATGENPPTLEKLVPFADGINCVEGIRSHLISRDLYETYKAGREREKNIRKTLGGISNSLNSIIGKIVNASVTNAIWKDPHALVAVNLGIYQGGNLAVELESISRSTDVLREYEALREEGGKPCLRKLAERVGMYSETVSYILERAGFPKEEIAQGRVVLSKGVRAAIKRILPLEMSQRDKAYFLRTPKHNLNNYMQHHLGDWGRAQVRHRYNWPDQLRVASQIYEAQSAGIKSVEDIGELLDVERETVERHIVRKPLLRSQIMGALNVVYGPRKKNVPWLTEHDRIQ